MLYIQESLAPGERILKFSQYHFIFVAYSFLGAAFYIAAAIFTLFIGVIYYYHDITTVPPWMIPKAAAALSFSDYLKALWHTNIIYRVMAFLFLFMAFIQVGSRLLVRMTTEMGVTNRRVVYKRGLISRKVEESRVDFIDGADLDQGIMGRIFNYGSVKVFGTGVEGIDFPRLMEDPVNFRRAILAARNLQTSPNTLTQQSLGEQQVSNNKAAPASENPRVNKTREDIEEDVKAQRNPQQYQQQPEQVKKLQEGIRAHGPKVTAEDLKLIETPDEEPPEVDVNHLRMMRDQ